RTTDRVHDTVTLEIHTLSLHDALPICSMAGWWGAWRRTSTILSSCSSPVSGGVTTVTKASRRTAISNRMTNRCAVCEGERSWEIDRKSTRLNSSHVKTSYAVFCLKKKT